MFLAIYMKFGIERFIKLKIKLRFSIASEIQGYKMVI